jgi:hypothetical protein
VKRLVIAAVAALALASPIPQANAVEGPHFLTGNMPPPRGPNCELVDLRLLAEAEKHADFPPIAQLLSNAQTRVGAYVRARIPLNSTNGYCVVKGQAAQLAPLVISAIQVEQQRRDEAERQAQREKELAARVEQQRRDEAERQAQREKELAARVEQNRREEAERQAQREQEWAARVEQQRRDEAERQAEREKELVARVEQNRREEAERQAQRAAQAKEEAERAPSAKADRPTTQTATQTGVPAGDAIASIEVSAPARHSPRSDQAHLMSASPLTAARKRTSPQRIAWTVLAQDRSRHHA